MRCNVLRRSTLTAIPHCSHSGSASYQVAPGFETHRPDVGSRPAEGYWYNDLEYGDKNKTDLNPFFYGVTLVHKPRDYTYQSDALSANMQLNDTHYQEQHSYRVEWEPPLNGTGGYIRWYTDEEFVFGVSGETLSVMGTEVPSEPMYLLMNTAVSSHWGFPAPCPSGCACECFECGKRDCECGMPDGYCDNFPASFDIDYVRVYQAVDDGNHILGCSPPTRPTDVFIQGHSERYMEDGQRRPLQPIVHGGGKCRSHSACGGRERGKCSVKGECICLESAVGPHCLAHMVIQGKQKEVTFEGEFSCGFLFSSFLVRAHAIASCSVRDGFPRESRLGDVHLVCIADGIFGFHVEAEEGMG